MVGKQKLLSVVVPVYNEAEGLEEFHNKLLLPNVKKFTNSSYEILYVNDGSKDSSLEIMTKCAKKNRSVKVINLSKNFGKEIAVTAGIFQASCKAIIVIDADGQHPPELIGEFIEKWEAGAQVVIGIRASNQKEGAIKHWGSKIFYQIFNSASGSEIVPRSTDFRLIDKVVQQEFIRCYEKNRITRGLIDWLGFDREYITFHSPARLAGRASYSTKQLMKLAVNSFISLSIKPLEILASFGLLITLLSLAAGVFIIIEQFLLSDPLTLNITGSAMLGVFMSFLIGLVMTSQGIVAIYISHIYVQSQGRPLFIINRTTSVNLDD